MHIRQLLSLIILCLASSATLTASGFSIQELGARASGMGGAFTSIANDGSAIYYNPAGIAFQEGFRIQMDASLVKGKFRFFPSASPVGTVTPEKGWDGGVRPKVQLLNTMFITRGLTRKLTFGFGVFSPYGLGDNWTNFRDADPAHTKFPGRFAGTRGRLESIWFQPTLAYRLRENMSVALGVAVVHTHLMLEQSILNPLTDGLDFGKELAPTVFPGQDVNLAARSIARMLPEGRARFAGTSQAPGVTMGYLFKHARSKTNVGLMYRSPVVHHLKGDASFAFTSEYPLKAFVGANTIPDLFPKSDIKGTFATPPSYNVGVSNASFWNSIIALDFQVEDYRRFQNVSLSFFPPTADTAIPAERNLSFDFVKTYWVRAGFEKPISDRTTLRAGYYLDRYAVADRSVGPLFPDNTKDVITLGFSRLVGNNKELTMFYQGANFRTRNTNVPANAKEFTNGTYDNFVHLLGFGLRLNWGGNTIRVDR